MILSRRAVIKKTLGVLGALALLASACGSGGPGTSPSAIGPARPASTARLRIVAPANGSVVRDPVILKVSLQGAKLVPATTATVVPDQGHLHVSVDGQLVTMTSGLTHELPPLAPGSHIVQVEFVASDHAPFDPRVIARASIGVRK